MGEKAIKMPRLSSRATFFYKRIFPAMWFGILLLVVLGFVAGSLRGGLIAVDSPPLGVLVVPVLMIIFGVVVMKKLVFDLVDEVFDAGDTLVVKNGHSEGRIALSEIMNVSYSPFMNPPRVTLSLRSPSRFGTQVSFCAPVRLQPFSFSTDPAIDALIERIDAARRRR